MKFKLPKNVLTIGPCCFNKNLYKVKGLGFTLVEVMIVVALIAALAVLAIPNIIRSRVIANESAARTTLKTIAVALETRASDTGIGYPDDFSVLLTGDPPYLNKDYIADSPFLGYNFACGSLELGSYSCSATPQRCGYTGSRIYTITTGSVFTDEAC